VRHSFLSHIIIRVNAKCRKSSFQSLQAEQTTLPFAAKLNRLLYAHFIIYYVGLTYLPCEIMILS